MKIELNTSVVAVATIIILGLFAAIVLFPRKENRLPNRFLSILLFSVALWLVDAFMRVSGIYSQNPDAYFKPIYYSFAFGPLIYFYVKSITNSTFQFKRKHLLHFIPVLIQGLLYAFLFFQDYSYKRWYWLEIHEPITYRIEFDGTFISLAIYLFFSIQLILNYQKSIRDHYSNLEKMKLNWLKIILLVLFFLCIQWFIEAVLRDFYENYYQFNYTTTILGLLTLILAYGGITQANLSHITISSNQENESERKIEIDPTILSAIRKNMEEDKAYTDPSLTLKSFSERCKIPSRKISIHINHGIKKSFHDYVNQCRVEETKRQLKAADLTAYTLQSVAYECGFNSKATFNRIFKSFTGLTPSEYLNQLD